MNTLFFVRDEDQVSIAFALKDLYLERFPEAKECIESIKLFSSTDGSLWAARYNLERGSLRQSIFAVVSLDGDQLTFRIDMSPLKQDRIKKRADKSERKNDFWHLFQDGFIEPNRYPSDMDTTDAGVYAFPSIEMIRSQVLEDSIVRH